MNSMNLHSIIHHLSPLAVTVGVSFNGSKTQEACADEPCRQSSAQRLPLPHSSRHSPNAHKAANNITILHSENDNILGPILAPNDQVKGVKLDDLYVRKPADEVSAGVFSTYLGLESLYIAANWIASPISSLLDKNKIDWAWHNFVENFLAQNTSVTRSGFVLTHDLNTMTRVCRNKGDLKRFCQRIAKKIKDNKKHIDAFMQRIGDKLIEKKYGIDITTRRIYKLLQHIDYLEQAFFEHEQREKSMLKHFQVHPAKSDSAGIYAAYLNSKHAIKDEVNKKIHQQLPHFDKLITFLFLATMELKPQVTPAMDYQGITKHADELIKNLLTSGELKDVNTTKWVYAHSDMKIPSDDIMKEIYKGQILNKELGIKHFGVYY